MKIDFTTVLVDLDDMPIESDGKKLTLAAVCEVALLSMTEETNKLPGDQKVHRATLAHSIHREGTLDVIAEDVSLLKDVVAKSYAPLVVMRAWEILDPKVKEVKEHGIQ